MPPTERQAQKAQTRALLLRVALSEFEEHGFEATTVRSIARAAGVGTGTLFVHFESKVDLLHAALHDQLEEIAADALASMPKNNLRRQLRHLVASFLGAFAKRPDLYVTLLRESLISTGAWSQRFRQQVERVAATVVQLFEQARVVGDLRAEASSQAATMAFFSFYYFLLIQAANNRFQDLETPLRQLDLLVAQLLAGLAIPPHDNQ